MTPQESMLYEGYPAIGLIAYAVFAIILAIQFRSKISLRPQFGGYSLYFASFLHLIVAVFFIFIDNTYHRVLAQFSYLLFLMGLYLAWTGAQTLRIPYIAISMISLLGFIGFTSFSGSATPIHRMTKANGRSISDLANDTYYEYLGVISTVAYYSTIYAMLIVATEKGN